MEKETEEKPIEQIEITKNKWLYPTDNFGKLEKNIVFESKTYQSGINETQTENFKIITVRKTKKIKKSSGTQFLKLVLFLANKLLFRTINIVRSSNLVKKKCS